jgi:hypothetical protein
MIVAFLLSEESPKDRDGFVRTALIIEEMQKWRFLPEQVEKALRKLTNKRLIETTERITFEEDLVGLIGLDHGHRRHPFLAAKSATSTIPIVFIHAPHIPLLIVRRNRCTFELGRPFPPLPLRPVRGSMKIQPYIYDLSEVPSFLFFLLYHCPRQL